MNNKDFSMPEFKTFSGLSENENAEDTDSLKEATNVLVTKTGHVISSPGISEAIDENITSVCLSHDGALLYIKNGDLYKVFYEDPPEKILDSVGDIDAGCVVRDSTVMSTKNGVYVHTGLLTYKVRLSSPIVHSDKAGRVMARAAYIDENGHEGELSDIFATEYGAQLTINNPLHAWCMLYTNEGGMLEDMHLLTSFNTSTPFIVPRIQSGTTTPARDASFKQVQGFSSAAVFDGRMWFCYQGSLFASSHYDYLMASTVPYADCNIVLGGVHTALVYSNNDGVFIIRPLGDMEYSNTKLTSNVSWVGRVVGIDQNSVYFMTDDGLYKASDGGTIKVVNEAVNVSNKPGSSSELVVDNEHYLIIGD